MSQLINEQLVLRIQAHDNEAENMLQLWQNNKKLITKIASSYRGSEIEDLEQEGYFGLCEAARHYNPDHSVPFANYAVFWIKGAIRRYIDNCTTSIRVPVGTRDEVRKYNKFVADYKKKFSEAPTNSACMDFLGINSKQLNDIQQLAKLVQLTSLDKKIISDNETVTLSDIIHSPEDLENDVINRVELERMGKLLHDSMELLPGSEREALEKHYFQEQTLKEIGEEQGLTVQKASKLVQNGLRKLRGNKYSKQLREYHALFFPTITVEYMGVGAFQRNWTSTTEKSVLYKLDRKQKK